MKLDDVENYDRIVSIISKKWVVEVILLLDQHKRLRFSEITEKLEGLSNKVLSSVLSQLVVHQIVGKVVHNIVPLTVKYELTPSGYELLPIISSLIEYGEHLNQM